MSLLTPIYAKVILALGIGLGASLVGNFLLVRHVWMEAGRQEGEKERAALASQVAGYEKTSAVNTALSERAKEDHGALLSEMREIAASARSNSARSRQVTRANPLPQVCFPGQARMDSVNKTLGPQ